MLFSAEILPTGEPVPCLSAPGNCSSSALTSPPPTSPEVDTTSPKNRSLEESSNDILIKEVAELREIFPHAAVVHVRNALLTCGANVETTAALLMGDPSDEIMTKVSKLKSLFAASTDDQILDALISSRGSMDDAVKQLKCEFAIFGEVSELLESANPLSRNLCLSDTLPYSSASSSTTSSSMASHVNGVVHSFTISTKTHPISPVKPKPEASVAKHREEGNPAKPVLIHYVSPSPPLKSEEEDTYFMPVLEDSLESKVANLLAILPNANRQACENTLQACDGNLQEAYELLENDDGHWDRSDRHQFGRFDLDREIKSRRGEVCYTDASAFCLKRRANSLDGLFTKKPRLLDGEYEGVEDDEGTGESNIQKDILLEPAGEWVRKYYPGDTRAKIILGRKEVPRNTIPKKVLYDNSTYFKQHFDAAEASEVVNEEVRLPHVSPELFDLSVQCLVSKNITLEPDTSRTKSAEITIILDLVLLAVELGFPDPGKPILDKLRNILVHKRRTLKPRHIQRAYTLAKGHGIRKLFVQATVQQYMKIRKDDISGYMPQYDSSDGEDIDEARLAAYPKMGFRYQREVDNIADFHLELLLEQDRILKSGEEEEVQAANKRTNKPAIMATVYIDPLDDNRFLL